MRKVTDESFDEDVLNSDHPVLVEFTASWCRPCQALVPMLDEVAEGHPGELAMFALDIDENRKTVEKYEIRGVPAVMIFSGGKLVKEHRGGFRNRSDLLVYLEEYL